MTRTKLKITNLIQIISGSKQIKLFYDKLLNTGFHIWKRFLLIPQLETKRSRP